MVSFADITHCQEVDAGEYLCYPSKVFGQESNHTFRHEHLGPWKIQPASFHYDQALALVGLAQETRSPTEHVPTGEH